MIEAEILIDETDTHQRLSERPLRSRKPIGVIQELYVLLIAHDAIRFLMHEAAVQHELDPERLSFVHALQVIQDAITEFQMVIPDEWPTLYQRLLEDLGADGKLPKRRHRSNPRVVKRKMSKWRLKRPEHNAWPQPTRPFCEAVAFICMVLMLSHRVHPFSLVESLWRGCVVEMRSCEAIVAYAHGKNSL